MYLHWCGVGRRQIVKCLIDIRRLFIETGDQRYILNDLYIDDYCVWTQHIRLISPLNT